jgi:glyoxylase-like metal-dependent hydrolase (beta-lactamase superfamily II)
MEEIAPGIWHWTARHPKIGIDVSSYWLPGERVLLDPLAVPAEVDEVEEILLSNRHHLRDSLAARERFGAAVRAPRPGMHEFAEDDQVEPYEFGDSLAGGAVTAHEVGAICPDEAALHIPSVRALSVADGVLHYGGELRFVPDGLMDDPEETKTGLRRAYARLADELEFDHLLTAHGSPVVGDAQARLREFART